MRRTLYTHELFAGEEHRFGKREDGTEYERFRVLLPEDVIKAIWKHHQCKKYHDLQIGGKGTCLDAVIEDLGLISEVSLMRFNDEIPPRNKDNEEGVGRT